MDAQRSTPTASPVVDYIELALANGLHRRSLRRRAGALGLSAPLTATLLRATAAPTAEHRPGSRSAPVTRAP